MAIQIKSFDLKKLKSQAAESIKDGAVTSDYLLNITQACENLNVALATEIMCVLRYRHHQIIAKGMNYLQIAAEFKEHAEDEEKHMLMLANRIKDLGGDPRFNPASVTEHSLADFGTATELREMIEEDLVAERVAIHVYRKLIEWFGEKDPTTRRLLEDILKEEEDHASEFADLLASGNEDSNSTQASSKQNMSAGLDLTSIEGNVVPH